MLDAINSLNGILLFAQQSFAQQSLEHHAQTTDTNHNTKNKYKLNISI